MNYPDFGSTPKSVTSQVFTMPSHVSIKEAEHGYKGFASAFIVRGLAKRAIRVILRPHFHRFCEVTQEEWILRAATVAAAKRWRTVVADPDDVEGDYMYAHSWSHYGSDVSHYRHHHPTYLGYIGESGY